MPLDGTIRRTKSKSTMAQAALRLFAAQTARREAETEWNAALAAAVKAAVIPDHAANPEPVGTNRVVYADDVVQISLSVAAPTVGIHFPGFVASLVKAGIDAKLIARLTKKHQTETKPAHKFTSSQVR